MRNDSLPIMNDVEQGRQFAPDYDTELMYYDVRPGQWQHICSARFGSSRTSRCLDGTAWSGSSYRYDIFKLDDGIRREYALRFQHGGGAGWLIKQDGSDSGVVSLLQTVSEFPDEARRWDACHFLYGVADKTARSAKRSEYVRIAEAFVGGRLKKKKERGRDSYRVTIEPKIVSTKVGL